MNEIMVEVDSPLEIKRNFPLLKLFIDIFFSFDNTTTPNKNSHTEHKQTKRDSTPHWRKFIEQTECFDSTQLFEDKEWTNDRTKIHFLSLSQFPSSPPIAANDSTLNPSQTLHIWWHTHKNNNNNNRQISFFSSTSSCIISHPRPHPKALPTEWQFPFCFRHTFRL